MKIIKLFLLLSLGLWSEFKLDIPQDINVSQLENIVENGWNNSNKTLNNLIVSYAERMMPEILKKIKKPILHGIVTSDNPFPPVRILLNKDDYIFIVSYIKYLEKMGQINKSKELYILLFEGMGSIKDKSILTVLFYIVNEKIVTDSLLNGINNYRYTSKIKSELEEKIQGQLILNYTKYDDAIEYEKKNVLKMTKTRFFRTPEEDSVGYIKLMTEVYDVLEENLNVYFRKMVIAINTTIKEKSERAINQFNIYIKEEKEIHMSFSNETMFALSTGKIKIKNFLGLENKTYGYMSKFTGKTIALIAIPKVGSTPLEFVKLVEKNKKLLGELKR